MRADGANEADPDRLRNREIGAELSTWATSVSVAAAGATCAAP